MTINEYRLAWKAHVFYDMWPNVPSFSERCNCGRKITRQINSTVTCGKCGYTVKSYEKAKKAQA